MNHQFMNRGDRRMISIVDLEALRNPKISIVNGVYEDTLPHGQPEGFIKNQLLCANGQELPKEWLDPTFVPQQTPATLNRT